jgi:hypothetical protein
MDEYPENLETKRSRALSLSACVTCAWNIANLDKAIQRIQQDPLAGELQLRRLKKHKLRLKDLIAQAESVLIPDLDA